MPNKRIIKISRDSTNNRVTICIFKAQTEAKIPPNQQKQKQSTKYNETKNSVMVLHRCSEDELQTDITTIDLSFFYYYKVIVPNF